MIWTFLLLSSEVRTYRDIPFYTVLYQVYRIPDAARLMENLKPYGLRTEKLHLDRAVTVSSLELTLVHLC